MPALGPALVGHDDNVVDRARRLPVPAVRHVEDVTADDGRPDLVPIRPDVVVGRLRNLQDSALVQRHFTAEQPVEQRSGLVVLVGDETVYRHRAVHDYLAQWALLCFGSVSKVATAPRCHWGGRVGTSNLCPVSRSATSPAAVLSHLTPRRTPDAQRDLFDERLPRRVHRGAGWQF